MGDVLYLSSSVGECPRTTTVKQVFTVMDMKENKICARIGACLVLFLTGAVSLASRAAAPQATVSSVEATPQTNFNGSVVSAKFTGGSLSGYTVALKIGDDMFAGAVSGDTMTFVVPGNKAAAGNIYRSTITATDNSGTYTLGAKNLYQGVQGEGMPTAWFSESAASPNMDKWDPDPTVEGGKFVFDDDAEEWEDGWHAFTPANPSAGQAAELVMDISFDAPLDRQGALVDDLVQASARLVTVAENGYRFALLDGGRWTTNTTFVAALNTDYRFKMAFDYRAYPARVTYSVKTGTVETVLLQNAVAGGNKLAIESIGFNGCGKMSQMTGSNITDTVDASLVVDGDATKYADPSAVPVEKRGNLTLLWNTAWNPDPTADGTWTINKGAYDFYINPSVTGVRVTEQSGVYTVIANYYELQKANDSSKKYMYLDDALADTAESSFELLRDLTASALTLPRDLAFNLGSHAFVTGTVALGAHTLNIVGGSAAVPFNVLTGTGTLTAGEAAPALLLKNVSGFEGSLGVAATAGGIAIGPNVTAAETGKITLAEGASASIASGKSWTAGVGIKVDGSLGGAGTLASATTFGNTAELTSGGLTASSAPTFGNALTVTITGAASGTRVMAVPTSMEDPTGTSVTVNEVTGFSLINRDGVLQLYKNAPAVLTVTDITEKPSTNFNGSTVTVAYSGYQKGSCVNPVAKLTVGGHEYVSSDKLEAGGGTLTFVVPSDMLAAGQIASAIVTVMAEDAASSASIKAYGGAQNLYQGAVTNWATNAWFSASASGSQLVVNGGAWTTPLPTASDGKILFPENEQTGELIEYGFTPTPQVAKIVVVETELRFDAAYGQDALDTSSMQGALRIVEDGTLFRFSALVNGGWQTNPDLVADATVNYTIRTTFDYSGYPSTVKYELKQGDAYVVIASGISRVDKVALGSAGFCGGGSLIRMTGTNAVAQLDASLVADESGKHYATIGDVPATKRGNLTLLWDTAWTPNAAVDGAWTIHAGEYKLYVSPTGEGVWVKNDNGTWTVYANYFEAMNLVFADSGIVTNKFTYFTNAVAQAGASITNLYLLHDVVLDTAVSVGKTITFNGETNILSGAGVSVVEGKKFIIEGGCIGIAPADRIELKGGRFTESTTNSWNSYLPSTYVWAKLATPVRTVVPECVYEIQPVPPGSVPGADEKLLPVTDANGEAVSVKVKSTWAEAKTGESKSADQSAVFSTKQGNGLTYMENAILGLANSAQAEVSANQIPVIQPVQSTSPTQVKFKLGNVKVDEDSGVAVKYRVFKSSNPGGKDSASSPANPTEEVLMDLPGSGVQYYLIEVDTGAVK